jgi:hypothetical protein
LVDTITPVFTKGGTTQEYRRSGNSAEEGFPSRNADGVRLATSLGLVARIDGTTTLELG